MKTILRFLLCPSLLALPLAQVWSAAQIEGCVGLSASSGAAGVKARYQGNITGLVAPPAAPVAVVYLEGDFPSLPATNLTAQVIQRQFQFLPAVLPVRKGTLVEFPNLDDSYHSVFSYSKPKRFDLGRYRKDEKSATVSFDQAGVVKLYCEIHEHMRATILVLDTPHFTTTDTNGGFRLENLPAGTFTLKAWLNEKTERQATVELTEGATLKVNFTAP